jgi:signal transduction histidine kinase
VLATVRLPERWRGAAIAVAPGGLLERARLNPARVLRSAAQQADLPLPPELAAQLAARHMSCAVISVGETQIFLALLLTPLASRSVARPVRAIELARLVTAQVDICARANLASSASGAGEALARSSEHGLRAHIARLLQLRDDERQRLARDLDGSVTQSLAAMKYTLEHSASLVHARDIDNAGRLLRQMVAQLQTLLGEVRSVTSRMHPTVLDDFGGVSAVQWLCREWSDAHPETQLIFECLAVDALVPDALKLPLFRTVQEALDNVARHARARRVIVALSHANGALSVEVVDEGIGFAAEQHEHGDGPGLGLCGMRERVSFSGGSFTVYSRPGRGAMLRAVWPLSSPTGAKESFHVHE